MKNDGEIKRVVLCADGQWPECNVHTFFGRCGFFHVLEERDEKINLIESIENKFKNAPSAGMSASSLVAEKKASAVVAGDFGPNASQALSQWDITMFREGGEALKAAKKAFLALKKEGKK